MIGLNLTHPRFVIENVDLGQRHDETCRGDFVKFKKWGRQQRRPRSWVGIIYGACGSDCRRKI